MSVEIINGDARFVLEILPSESFDCVIVDPPYGETSLTWDTWPKEWPEQVRRVLKPSGSMWVFGSFRSFVSHWLEFDGFRNSHEIVWEKHNGTGLFNDRFRRVHELACHFYRKDSPWKGVFKNPQFTNDATARTVRKKGRPAQWLGATGETIYTSEDGGPRLVRSVMQIRSEHGRAVHPTQKPVDLVRPLLSYACPVGGSVLDPFAGSGTVGVVAKELGMKATLIEANPCYCDIAKQRIKLGK